MELVVKRQVLVFDHKNGTFSGFSLDHETSHGRKLAMEFPFDIANSKIGEEARKTIVRVTINGILNRLSIIGMFNSGR